MLVDQCERVDESGQLGQRSWAGGAVVEPPQRPPQHSGGSRDVGRQPLLQGVVVEVTDQRDEPARDIGGRFHRIPPGIGVRWLLVELMRECERELFEYGVVRCQ